MSKQNWGPKMAALPNDKWRKFVLELLEGTVTDGHGSKGHTAALRRAGWKGKPESLRVTAYRMFNDVRVQEAVREECGKRFTSALPLATKVFEEIAADPVHKDRLAAAKEIVNRGGLAEVARTEHTFKVILEDPIQLERVRQLAERVGIPLDRLIGRQADRLLPRAPAIEAEFEETDNE